MIEEIDRKFSDFSKQLFEFGGEEIGRRNI